jgi:hypothetical protein
MADIQPKNTDTIRVNVITEKTGASGVSINSCVKANSATALTPVSATIDLGGSAAATHYRKTFTKEITSEGQSITIGTNSAHSCDLKSTGLTRVSIGSDGTITQDATNGGSLVWTKTSTAVAQASATALTAAGTIISDALALVNVFNHVTTAAAATGVKLWDAPIGTKIEVVNSGANALNVFPHSASGTMNGGAAGAAVSVATNTYNIFVRVSSTNWIAREITSAAA